MFKEILYIKIKIYLIKVKKVYKYDWGGRNISRIW